MKAKKLQEEINKAGTLYFIMRLLVYVVVVVVVVVVVIVVH